jgi:DNA-binding response OmpR family regulator
VLLTSVSVASGYPTVSVAGGAAAWEIFQDSPAQIVITGWLVTDVDGYELCARIRETAGDQCVVILLTPSETGVDLPQALGGGIDDFLSMPAIPEQISARLSVAERMLAAARARRTAELEASRLRWLAGIGQVALTFQHEINNPLTALYAHLEFLGRNASLDPQGVDDVAGALVEARRIASIVAQIAAPGPKSVGGRISLTQFIPENTAGPRG